MDFIAVQNVVWHLENDVNMAQQMSWQSWIKS